MMPAMRETGKRICCSSEVHILAVVPPPGLCLVLHFVVGQLHFISAVAEDERKKAREEAKQRREKLALENNPFPQDSQHGATKSALSGLSRLQDADDDVPSASDDDEEVVPQSAANGLRCGLVEIARHFPRSTCSLRSEAGGDDEDDTEDIPSLRAFF
eukprot:2183390-Amphidinium_carterae.1